MIFLQNFVFHFRLRFHLQEHSEHLALYLRRRGVPIATGNQRRKGGGVKLGKLNQVVIYLSVFE
jgi:hypothetical protein